VGGFYGAGLVIGHRLIVAGACGLWHLLSGIAKGTSRQTAVACKGTAVCREQVILERRLTAR